MFDMQAPDPFHDHQDELSAVRGILFACALMLPLYAAAIIAWVWL